MTATSIIPCLTYEDADQAVEWLCEAFGFVKHQLHKTDDGLVVHAELKLGQTMIMMGSHQYKSPFGKLIKHPREIGGFETQSPYIVIPDIDAHYARAVNHGAEIVIDLRSEDYGGKNYSCYDPEGHLWNFGSYDPWAAGSK